MEDWTPLPRSRTDVARKVSLQRHCRLSPEHIHAPALPPRALRLAGCLRHSPECKDAGCHRSISMHRHCHPARYVSPERQIDPVSPGSHITPLTPLDASPFQSSKLDLRWDLFQNHFVRCFEHCHEGADFC